MEWGLRNISMKRVVRTFLLHISPSYVKDITGSKRFVYGRRSEWMIRKLKEYEDIDKMGVNLEINDLFVCLDSLK